MSLLSWSPYQGEDTPPPEHVTFGEIVADRIGALKPPSRVTVDEAGERHRMVFNRGTWIPWKNDVAPYMIEPQRQVTSRRYAGLIFLGPARSSKSAALIENSVAHSIACDPKIVHVVQMSRESARTYAEEKLSPMIRNSPDLAAEQAAGYRADNMMEKRFNGGGKLTVGWPVVSQLSSRDMRLVLVTDLDRMPLDIGGEGSIYVLARKRIQTEGSRGMVVMETSPGWPVTSEVWKPTTPHEAPPAAGGLALYNQGTRARFYYRCPDCGEAFEPRFERIDYDIEAPTPLEAGETARLICPHCGSVHSQSARKDLNANGQWLHETGDGGVSPLSSETRPTDLLSYWLPGPCAWSVTWAELVAKYEAARRKAEATDDEADLKSVTNVDLGLPFLSKVRKAGGELDAETLRARALDYELDVAPDWVRFVTIAVDTQKGRFVWQADAWGVGLERRVIGRGELFKAPKGAPGAGKRAIDPARYGEDWAALLELSALEFPIEGTEATIRAAYLGVDMQGEAGVTEKAKAFWRKRRKAGDGRRWHLIRGRGGVNRENRFWRAAPETASKGRRAAKDVLITNLAVDLLKDDVFAQLTREERGPRCYSLSSRLPVEFFDEMAGERRGDKGWTKKEGVVRNEAFDLGVYSLGLALWAKAEKVDYDNPPAWAATWERNAYVTAPDSAKTETASEKESAKMKDRSSETRAARAARRLRRRLGRG